MSALHIAQAGRDGDPMVVHCDTCEHVIVMKPGEKMECPTCGATLCGECLESLRQEHRAERAGAH